MNKANLLIIDDDIELSNLLKEYLIMEGFNVTACFDGAAGLAKSFDDTIDLILLDVMMPKLDGFEVLKALGGNHKTPILMLTAKGDDNDRVKGLELGADDYLAKPFHHKELLARIKAILRRVDITKNSKPISSVVNVNNVSIEHATRVVQCNQHAIELTGTEYEILNCLMTEHGSIVSKDTLSEKVLGRKLSPFDRSIDMHVSNIRRKLMHFTDQNKIKTVRGAGYIFLTGEQSA